MRRPSMRRRLRRGSTSRSTGRARSNRSRRRRASRRSSSTASPREPSTPRRRWACGARRRAPSSDRAVTPAARRAWSAVGELVLFALVVVAAAKLGNWTGWDNQRRYLVVRTPYWPFYVLTMEHAVWTARVLRVRRADRVSRVRSGAAPRRGAGRAHGDGAVLVRLLGERVRGAGHGHGDDVPVGARALRHDARARRRAHRRRRARTGAVR